jgi:pimeloyl-ACP methyl ester carboxylesterase
VADQLAGECRMLWYDRRGYGDSLEAAGAPVAVEGHVADLLAVLDGRRAVVVGHSFGGVTAMVAAIEAPELVSALVLYETGMAWIPGWDDAHMSSVLWADDPEAAGVQMMLRDRVEGMDGGERATWLARARAFVVEERSVRTGTAPLDLGSLKVPLIYGTDHESMATIVSRHLLEVVDGVEIVEFTGAGHNAHRSQPEAFADLVRRGLAAAT